LKKLEEDYAEKYAHMVLQFNQEKGQYTATIKELKGIIEEENEEWSMKVSSIRKEN
jgi:hypothetical protein